MRSATVSHAVPADSSSHDQLPAPRFDARRNRAHPAAPQRRHPRAAKYFAASPVRLRPQTGNQVVRQGSNDCGAAALTCAYNEMMGIHPQPGIADPTHEWIKRYVAARGGPPGMTIKQIIDVAKLLECQVALGMDRDHSNTIRFDPERLAAWAIEHGVGVSPVATLQKGFGPGDRAIVTIGDAADRDKISHAVLYRPRDGSFMDPATGRNYPNFAALQQTLHALGQPADFLNVMVALRKP